MNLFVGNLNPETNINSLRPLFAEFGEVVSAKIIFDNATGMSRGFGFVEMADKFHAMDAIDNLDCTFFEGNIISVKEAKQNNSRTGGGPGGNRGGGQNRSFRPRTPRTDYNSNRGGDYGNRSNDYGNRSNDYGNRSSDYGNRNTDYSSRGDFGNRNNNSNDFNNNRY